MLDTDEDAYKVAAIEEETELGMKGFPCPIVGAELDDADELKAAEDVWEDVAPTLIEALAACEPYGVAVAAAG